MKFLEKRIYEDDANRNQDLQRAPLICVSKYTPRFKHLADEWRAVQLFVDASDTDPFAHLNDNEIDPAQLEEGTLGQLVLYVKSLFSHQHILPILPTTLDVSLSHIIVSPRISVIS